MSFGLESGFMIDVTRGIPAGAVAKWAAAKRIGGGSFVFSSVARSVLFPKYIQRYHSARVSDQIVETIVKATSSIPVSSHPLPDRTTCSQPAPSPPY